MSNYKCGLVSVSFRQNSPAEILSAMRNTGLSYIEWGSDIHAPCDDEKKLNKIVRLQKKYDIKCCSYGTYFRLGETDLKELPKYISAAKMLGTDVLRLWCGNKGYGEYSEDEKAKLFDECKKAAKIAEDAGVVLCMECHNHTFTDVESGAYELMRAVDSSSFRMYWQPNQFKSFEENVSYAKSVLAYTERIHVFNWCKDVHSPLLQAVDVWRKYLEFFDNIYLLLEFMPDDKIESLKAEADALREIIGKNGS